MPMYFSFNKNNCTDLQVLEFFGKYSGSYEFHDIAKQYKKYYKKYMPSATGKVDWSIKRRRFFDRYFDIQIH